MEPTMEDEAAPTVEDFLVPDEENAPAEDVAAEDAEQPDDALAEQVDEQEEAEPEADDADEEEPDEQEEVVKTPAPASWSKEDKKAWDALTPEAQQVVLRREQERDKYVREAGRKAAETKVVVENQAREVIAKQAEEYAQQLQAYAARNLPEPPDQRLLYTGNPDDVLVYHRQDAAYRASTAQQQALQQEIERAQQQAETVRSQAEQAERAVEAQRLQEQLPEWFDASTGPKLQSELQSIGSELGYPVELMAEASATDILALKKASEWKAKADRFDKLVAKRMETVRAAKGLPKMARPGTTPSRGQANVQATSRKSEALKSFSYTRSSDDAAALLLERKR